MSIFRKHNNKHDINIDNKNIIIRQKHILVGYSKGNSDLANHMEFNIYIDEINKIIHIYDALKRNTTSVINKLNEDFIRELCDVLNINLRKFEVYVYTTPVTNDTPYITAFNYKNNSFYKADKNNLLNIFINLAENHEDILK